VSSVIWSRCAMAGYKKHLMAHTHTHTHTHTAASWRWWHTHTHAHDTSSGCRHDAAISAYVCVHTCTHTESQTAAANEDMGTIISSSSSIFIQQHLHPASAVVTLSQCQLERTTSEPRATRSRQRWESRCDVTLTTPQRTARPCVVHVLSYSRLY
jgi:hypothetical protein